MATHELIDAQFDRAVEIVQSLPKTGPIQTDYEEKLTMYSLFKQATSGNVRSLRPGIWDMLGRAKWDAWAKHRDLDSYEAKWLYVDALLKVLRKYSDKTVAMNLVEELESYGGDTSHIVMSRTLSRSPHSSTSGSTIFEAGIPPLPRANLLVAGNTQHTHEGGDETDSTSDEESEDEANELPVVNNAVRASRPVEPRPQSSVSSHRYRTPLAGSIAMSPPLQHQIPSQQPLPGFETPSAFADPSATPTYPHSTQYLGPFPESSRSQMASPPHLYAGHPSFRPVYSHPAQVGPIRPPSTTALERAVENVQIHLSALSERIETLESRSLLLSRSNVSGSPRGHGGGVSPWIGGRGSPNGAPIWDIDDLGMWSMVLNPFSRGLDHLREISTFFSTAENRSPSTIIIRRLCLDISFLICAVAVVRALWRKSGVRRKEVKAALVILWRAIVGSKSQRSLVEKGV